MTTSNKEYMDVWSKSITDGKWYVASKYANAIGDKRSSEIKAVANIRKILKAAKQLDKGIKIIYSNCGNGLLGIYFRSPSKMLMNRAKNLMLDYDLGKYHRGIATLWN